MFLWFCLEIIGCCFGHSEFLETKPWKRMLRSHYSLNRGNHKHINNSIKTCFFKTGIEYLSMTSFCKNKNIKLLAFMFLYGLWLRDGIHHVEYTMCMSLCNHGNFLTESHVYKIICLNAPTFSCAHLLGYWIWTLHSVTPASCVDLFDKTAQILQSLNVTDFLYPTSWIYLHTGKCNHIMSIGFMISLYSC